MIILVCKVIVTGPVGSGKTEVINRIKDALTDKYRAVDIVPVSSNNYETETITFEIVI